VLLDSEGHIRVTDFGLAKPGLKDDSRTNSFIGTMEVCWAWHVMLLSCGPSTCVCVRHVATRCPACWRAKHGPVVHSIHACCCIVR
jgi:hypothetical protein